MVRQPESIAQLPPFSWRLAAIPTLRALNVHHPQLLPSISIFKQPETPFGKGKTIRFGFAQARQPVFRLPTPF